MLFCKHNRLPNPGKQEIRKTLQGSARGAKKKEELRISEGIAGWHAPCLGTGRSLQARAGLVTDSTPREQMNEQSQVENDSCNIGRPRLRSSRPTPPASDGETPDKRPPESSDGTTLPGQSAPQQN